MMASLWFHKRKALFFGVLFLAFSAFSADVLDLREELHILAYPYSCLDNNVSTGLTSDPCPVLEQMVISGYVQQNVFISVTFLHLLPYGNRAPPSSRS
jgi:hypothetical protein